MFFFPLSVEMIISACAMIFHSHTSFVFHELTALFDPAFYHSWFLYLTSLLYCIPGICCHHSPGSGKWAVFRKGVMLGLATLCLPNKVYMFRISKCCLTLLLMQTLHCLPHYVNMVGNALIVITHFPITVGFGFQYLFPASFIPCFHLCWQNLVFYSRVYSQECPGDFSQTIRSNLGGLLN